MLLKIDFGELSVLRVYSLQGPTMSCTLIVLCSLDHRMTSLNHLCFRELPVYAHWVVFSLGWSLNHIAFPYGRWYSAVYFIRRYWCLTAVYKDGSEPGQALPLTVSPLQLWSYIVVYVIDYEGTIYSSRWVVQGPPDRGQWVSYVPCLYPIAFILFVYLWESMVCTTCV